jgi:hypothetical protein
MAAKSMYWRWRGHAFGFPPKIMMPAIMLANGRHGQVGRAEYDEVADEGPQPLAIRGQSLIISNSSDL